MRRPVLSSFGLPSKLELRRFRSRSCRRRRVDINARMSLLGTDSKGRKAVANGVPAATPVSGRRRSYNGLALSASLSHNLSLVDSYILRMFDSKTNVSFPSFPANDSTAAAAVGAPTCTVVQ